LAEIAELVLEKALAAPYSEQAAAQVDHPGGRGSTTEPMIGLMVAVLHKLRSGPLVVAVSREAAALAADIDCFAPGEVFHLPGAGPGGDWFRPYEDAVGQRLKAARELRAGNIAVMGVEALIGGMPSALPEHWPMEIRVGMELDLERALGLLVEGGYEREYTVEGWGRLAVRGGILDIFPSTAERPVRVELEGDTVASLREFNVVTQRSGARLDTVEVFPASDPGHSMGGFGCDSLEGAVVVAVNRGLLDARVAEFCTEAGIEAPAGSLLDGWGRVLSADTIGGRKDAGAMFPGEPVREFRGDLDAAVETWRKLSSGGTEVFLLLDGKGQVDRARELWHESGGRAREPRMGVGSLRRGFHVPTLKLALGASRAAPRSRASRSWRSGAMWSTRTRG
jgi:hypothetical protein